MELFTKRTLLRRPELKDLKDLRLLESDPDVMKFTLMRRPQTEDESLARLQKNILLQNEREPLGIWLAYLLDEPSQFVGCVMLFESPKVKTPELGFMIPRKHWRKGFATEICGRIIDYAGNDLQLSGLHAVTDTDNLASQALLRNLNFTEGAALEPDAKYFYLKM